MKKMKIIISANVLFTITNFRKDLIYFFNEKNIDVVCLANTDDLSSSSIDFLNKLNIKFIKIDVSRKGLNPIEDLKYLYKLIKIYKREKPDLVMHFTIKPNIYGSIACKIANIPSINTINGLGSAIIKENFLSKVLQWMYRFSLRFSSKVFFQNNDDLSFFVKKSLVKEEMTAIVPGSGVDTSSFQRSSNNSEKLVFLLVSRLLKDKGIYEYIEAIENLNSTYKNKAEFLLAGQYDEGNPSAITSVQIDNWEEKKLIKYIGKTDDIKTFFAISDVIVLPSYREGLSRVLIEAASSYKPIITTNVAGCKDVVEDSINGFLCMVKNSNSLQISIEKMLNLSSAELTQMGLNSKKIAEERFDKKIVNEIYYKEIKKICFI